MRRLSGWYEYEAARHAGPGAKGVWQPRGSGEGQEGRPALLKAAAGPRLGKARTGQNRGRLTALGKDADWSKSRPLERAWERRRLIKIAAA